MPIWYRKMNAHRKKYYYPFNFIIVYCLNWSWCCPHKYMVQWVILRYCVHDVK